MTKARLRERGVPELPPEALAALALGGQLGLLRLLKHLALGRYVCPEEGECGGIDEDGGRATVACGLCQGVRLLVVSDAEGTFVGPGETLGVGLDYQEAREEVERLAQDMEQRTGGHRGK